MSTNGKKTLHIISGVTFRIVQIKINSKKTSWDTRGMTEIICQIPMGQLCLCKTGVFPVLRTGWLHLLQSYCHMDLALLVQ